MRISDWSSDVCSSDLKEPKGFGGMAQIEGGLDEGQRVLLVEDLTTDGGSKAKFVHALRQAGATVDNTYVVFHYGIFPALWQPMSALGGKLARKSAVLGKSVSVRLDFGGRTMIKK